MLDIVQQKVEILPAKLLIYHEPHRSFVHGNMHPAAYLYQDATSLELINESFNSLRQNLKEEGVACTDLRELILKDRKALQQFCRGILKYSCRQEHRQKLLPFLSEEYKQKTVQKMDDATLLEVIVTRPQLFLIPDPYNNLVQVQHVKTKPVSNLLFCRDAQIITAKGLVLCHLNSKVREFQTQIFRLAWTNMGIKPIGQIPKDCYLQGGDFMTIKRDLALCGIGHRSNIGACMYLMENDLLGTDRFAIIQDKQDLDQQRMHLDTYFNQVNEKTVLLLDFQTVPNPERKQLNRRAHVYVKSEGKYAKEKEIQFEQFLAQQGFHIVKVTHQQQLKYMINIISIGNNTILTCHAGLQEKLKSQGVQCRTKFVKFQGAMRMYGSLHCATQIFR